MNPTPLSGANPNRPRKRSAWKGKAVLALFLIGIGFYSGVRTTLRVADSAPDWLKRPFGVAEWKKAADLPVDNGISTAPLKPNNAAVPSVPTGDQAPVTPANPPPTGVNGQVNRPTQPTNVPVTSNTAPPVVTATDSELSGKVSEYNRQLYKIQSVFNDFNLTRNDSRNTSLPAERTQAAGERLTGLTDELVSSVQKAQTMYEEIERQPLTSTKYRAGETAIDPAIARTAFPEMSVGNLRFFLPK